MFGFLRRIVTSKRTINVFLVGLAKHPSYAHMVLTHRVMPNTKRVVVTIPTRGFQVEVMKSPWTRINVICWDVWVADRIMNLWRHYYQNSKALLFVVDSSDIDQMEGAVMMHRDRDRSTFFASASAEFGGIYQYTNDSRNFVINMDLTG
jgi:GTPase SAR1 family protein